MKMLAEIRSWLGDRARRRRIVVLLACQVVYSASFVGWWMTRREAPDWRLIPVFLAPLVASAVVAHRVNERHRRQTEDLPTPRAIRHAPD